MIRFIYLFLQYYDFSDVAEDAARQFTDFLANKFSANLPVSITDQIRDEVRRKANSIATYALNEDEHLLAFALAAPSIHTVVVKFRENVTVSIKSGHKMYIKALKRRLLILKTNKGNV